MCYYAPLAVCDREYRWPLRRSNTEIPRRHFRLGKYYLHRRYSTRVSASYATRGSSIFQSL